MPPSPVVIDLRGWKLKRAEVAERAGVAAVAASAPNAQAASSTTHRPCRRGDRVDGVHVRAQPEQVHRDDPDGPLGRSSASICATSMLNVSRSMSQKTRRGAHVLDDVGGRDPGERGHDHLVARARGRAPRRRGAARSCTRSSRPRAARRCRLAKRSSNSRDVRPCTTQPLSQRLLDRLELLGAEERLGDRDLRSARGSAGADVRASHSVRPRGAVGSPPLDDRLEPLTQRHLGAEAEQRARPSRCCRRGW